MTSSVEKLLMGRGHLYVHEKQLYEAVKMTEM